MGQATCRQGPLSIHAEATLCSRVRFETLPQLLTDTPSTLNVFLSALDVALTAVARV